MTSRGSASALVWRHVFLTLAALAVTLKVLLPPGLMVSAEPRNELPFAIVLCTAQGMVEVAPSASLPKPSDQDQVPTSKHDAPCVFAAQGAAAPPPTLADAAAVEFVAFTLNRPAIAPAVSPGRGLSGPPLPARGPPAQLI